MTTPHPPVRRIGLFGGSFDPVHNAHLALARTALVQLPLDELRWLPTGQAWHKTRGLSDAEDRAAMVALAIQDEPRFRLERCELDRAGPSYTIDTLRQLQAAEPGQRWFLLIGQDQHAGLHTWHDWRELLQRVTLAVAARPGAPRPAHAEVLQAGHHTVDMPAMPVSSTDIRTRLAAGQGIDGLVPAAVARYIDLHHLYRGNTGS